MPFPSSQNISAKSPIGIFDSGIGGLTIVEHIKLLLPNEQLIYVADNKYAPYGDKSQDDIIARVNAIADYFINQSVKAIVIACNTATAIAIDQLRARINIPVVGVEPAVKPATLRSENQKIAVLTTQATSTNVRFLQLIATHSGNAKVLIQPCPGLVEQIEQGHFETTKTRTLLTEYLTPLKSQGIDKLVLGCTHYPLLNKQIKAIVGDDIELIDTGAPVAKRLQQLLSANNMLSSHLTAPHCWYSTKALSTNTQTSFPHHWQALTITNALSK